MKWAPGDGFEKTKNNELFITNCDRIQVDPIAVIIAIVKIPRAISVWNDCNAFIVIAIGNWKQFAKILCKKRFLFKSSKNCLYLMDQRLHSG